jgi:DNA-binding transcriptional ArsR family regulator
MEDSDFISIASLICESARARILWKLLDGKAYTATELGLYADLSPTSVSNHLSKLLRGNILKVDVQGRHRYYSFSDDNVAYVIEALASLGDGKKTVKSESDNAKKGINYCRTCYDHLAGYVGVVITDAMVDKGYLDKSKDLYLVTSEGWDWFSQLQITKNDLVKSRRPLARKCLDWSERRPHLAGHLGAVFLKKALEYNWFKKIQFSRELVITYKGREFLSNSLGVIVQ